MTSKTKTYKQWTLFATKLNDDMVSVERTLTATIGLSGNKSIEGNEQIYYTNDLDTALELYIYYLQDYVENTQKISGTQALNHIVASPEYFNAISKELNVLETIRKYLYINKNGQIYLSGLKENSNDYEIIKGWCKNER